MHMVPRIKDKPILSFHLFSVIYMLSPRKSRHPHSYFQLHSSVGKLVIRGDVDTEESLSNHKVELQVEA